MWAQATELIHRKGYQARSQRIGEGQNRHTIRMKLAVLRTDHGRSRNSRKVTLGSIIHRKGGGHDEVHTLRFATIRGLNMHVRRPSGTPRAPQMSRLVTINRTMSKGLHSKPPHEPLNTAMEVMRPTPIRVPSVVIM